MVEKIDLYDITTAMLHGVLFLAYTFFLFPQIIVEMKGVELPEVVIVIVFIAITYFCGQVLSAIASMMQRFLDWSWGGKPSDIVMDKRDGCGYISCSAIDRAITMLKNNCGGDTSNRSLFNAAIVIARSSASSLTERHNRMYAYYRVCFVNLLLCIVSFFLSCSCGRGHGMAWSTRIVSVLTLLLLITLHWIRAKQRAFYFVREVLFVATRELTKGDQNGV